MSDTDVIEEIRELLRTTENTLPPKIEGAHHLKRCILSGFDGDYAARVYYEKHQKLYRVEPDNGRAFTCINISVQIVDRKFADDYKPTFYYS